MSAGAFASVAGIGRLRGIGEADVEPMRQWRNAAGVRANMFTRHEIGVDEHAAWWARTRARADQAYFVYEHDGVACGIGALNGIDTGSRNTAWALYAAPGAPRGTGSCIGALLLDHAFGALALNKVYCEAFAFNRVAVALYHRLGFVTEGTFREQHDYDGRLVDVLRLGILAREWAAGRDGFLAALMQHRSHAS
jgi:UDP-4-amino-4,6-dideoxy-N-acetyl-beta-L-altrosamine N-acetyltransferase